MNLRNIDKEMLLNDEQHTLLAEIIKACPKETLLTTVVTFVDLVIAAQKLMPYQGVIRSRQALVCLALQAGLRPC